jgi:hypothetical protein
MFTPQPEPETASDRELPTAVVSSEDAASATFGRELWARIRPYLLLIATDSLVTLALYLVLLGFQRLARLLPIPGWEGEWIQHIHGIGIIGAFVLFAFLIVRDLYRIHKK